MAPDGPAAAPRGLDPAHAPLPVTNAGEDGERAPGRWINCGTVMAALGFLLFAFFGWVLLQFLCTGQGTPGSGWMDFPG